MIHLGQMLWVPFFVLLGMACGVDSVAAEQDKSAVDAIRESAESYLKALTGGEAEAIAAHWTENGTFVDESGQTMNAHELIGEQFKAERRGKAIPPPAVESSSIRFITSDVAVEEGLSTWMPPEASRPVKGRYSAIWVNRKGRWLLASLRESALTPIQAAGPLEPLSWMIGEWATLGGELPVRALATWSDNQKFIMLRYTIERERGGVLHAQQRIGWDPSLQQIRSWAFDSDGAIVEGLWRQEDDAWIVETSATSPEGKKSKSVDFWLPEGRDRFVIKLNPTLADGTNVKDVVLEFVRTSGGP